MTESTSDNELWYAFRHGNEQALAQLFLGHYDSLFRYGRRLIRDEELVKDCIQDLFHRLWLKRESLTDVKVIKPYLFKSLRHLISDQCIKQNRERSLRLPAQPFFEVVFSHEDFIISTQLSGEQALVISQALNHLSTRQREAIYLRFFDGLEYDKIAEVMNVHVQSVRNLVCQGVKSLKDILSPIHLSWLLLCLNL